LRLQGVPNDGIDLQSYVERTDGYNGADMDYLCEKAKEHAIKRILKAEQDERTLRAEDFENAFAAMHSSVLDVDRKEMERWEQEFARQA
jgi:SpoVK/Ycf46/Vps4 family AAA+-type ATPase